LIDFEGRHKVEEVLEVGDADLRRLHRHFINLMCRDAGLLALQRHGGPALYNFSAFVVEVDGLWLAVRNVSMTLRHQGVSI
jgi:hypothetical protein